MRPNEARVSGVTLPPNQSTSPYAMRMMVRFLKMVYTGTERYCCERGRVSCCRSSRGTSRKRTHERLGPGVDDEDEEERDGEPPARVLAVPVAERDDLRGSSSQLPVLLERDRRERGTHAQSLCRHDARDADDRLDRQEEEVHVEAFARHDELCGTSKGQGQLLYEAEGPRGKARRGDSLLTTWERARRRVSSEPACGGYRGSVSAPS
mgnify:CR=1 FL=1